MNCKWRGHDPCPNVCNSYNKFGYIAFGGPIRWYLCISYQQINHRSEEPLTMFKNAFTWSDLLTRPALNQTWNFGESGVNDHEYDVSSTVKLHAATVWSPWKTGGGAPAPPLLCTWRGLARWKAITDTRPLWPLWSVYWRRAYLLSVTDCTSENLVSLSACETCVIVAWKILV